MHMCMCRYMHVLLCPCILNSYWKYAIMLTGWVFSYTYSTPPKKGKTRGNMCWEGARCVDEGAICCVYLIL